MVKEPILSDFEIVASTETKTTIDGFQTAWVAGDEINLFHAESSTNSYVNDKIFSIAEEDLATGKFKGTLSGSLTADKYDWYTIYPYKPQITSPVAGSGYQYIGSRSDKAQTQTGLNSTAHLCGTNYPLYGIAKNVSSGDTPSFMLKPAFSVIEINISNATTSELEVASISFTAPKSIVGTFYIDFSGEVASYSDATYVSNTANLTVSSATIPVGGNGKFYIAVKPFSATTGQQLKISVNGIEKIKDLTEDITFSAGKIKTLNYTFNSSAKSETLGPDWNTIFGTTYDGSFNPKANELSLSGTVGDVTINVTNGKSTNGYIKSGSLRVYANYNVVLSVPSGKKITKIITTAGGLNYAKSAISADSGTISVADNATTWEGNAESVKFSFSAKVGFGTITVLYE